jgi:hypothetical protein
MLAGRLVGTLDGRPVVIEADALGILVSVVRLRSLWSLRTIAGSMTPTLRLLNDHGIPVRMKIAGIVSLDVLPRPSALARFFAPVLARVG